MPTTNVSPTVESLTTAVRNRARAEAAEVEAMVVFRDVETARTEGVQPLMRRQVERAAIPLTIGEAMGLSEGQVQLRLSIADRVRAHAPQAWAAFSDGLIDLARVRDISHTIDQLHRPESHALLDGRVVAYATGHTAAELRVWLRRFVQRVEADLAVERAEAEKDKRHVSISHGDDAMGWLTAYLPSHELAAIGQRLHHDARRGVDPDDTRTTAQREADQLIAWCTDSDATTSAVTANIAVTIDADVLAAAVAGFAESTDGRWAVPATWRPTMRRAKRARRLERAPARAPR